MRKMCVDSLSYYILNQAPKTVACEIDKIVLSNSFKINKCDKCV